MKSFFINTFFDRKCYCIAIVHSLNSNKKFLESFLNLGPKLFQYKTFKFNINLI